MIPIAIGIVLRIIPIAIGSGGRQFSASLPIGKQGNRHLRQAANRYNKELLTDECNNLP